jgi:cyclase
LFESRHFTIEQLADGVFAAVHRPGGWAIANAGIIDLGDFTLIYDSFMTIQAAEDLLAAAKQLAKSPVKLVISSHYHNDHIWGSQVFGPQAFVLSSKETRSLIKTRGKEEYDWFSENSASELKSLQAEYRSESDEDKKSWIEFLMSYFEGLVETMPDLSVRLPDLTFDEKLEIHGTGRSVELIAFQNGHTPNDTLLYLPADGILFLSDLLFIEAHPFLADGDPDSLLLTCDQIAAFDASILVPGHGAPGTKEDLQLMKEYISNCRQTVEQMLENDQPLDAISQQAIPEPYQEWEFSTFYAANLRSYYQRLAPKQDGF